MQHVKSLDDTKMSDISSTVNLVKILISDLIVMKKGAIFSDKQMSRDIF